MNNENINNSDNSNNVTSLSNYEVTSRTAFLWKYNPVPDSPMPFPEYANKCYKDKNYEIIAARARGKKHKHDGTNCDDWYECVTYDNCVFAAVADGAGSKPFSRIGARVSCETAILSIKNKYTDIIQKNADIKEKLAMSVDSKEFSSACSLIADALQDSVIDAGKAVSATYEQSKDNSELKSAVKRNIELKDFSSTLLVAVIIPVSAEGLSEQLVLTVQIGDGCICTVNKNSDIENALKILGTADSGDFAGETEFLVSKCMADKRELQKRTKIQKRKITTLMLMTDGVADDYYPVDNQMLRLYSDLVLNGIIDNNADDVDVEEQHIDIPAPLEYPWVNDCNVRYSLQYAKNIINSSNITLQQLWNDKRLMEKASLKSFDKSVKGDDRSEKLLVWLDNYVERGSFDDRTLIVINTGDLE